MRSAKASPTASTWWESKVAELPPDATHTAVFLDGRSNRKRSVELRFGPALDIVEQGAVVETWPYDQVRRADGPPGLLRLSSETAAPLARLEIADAATVRMVAANCKALNTGHASNRQTGRIVAWSAAAVCSILGLTYFGIPYAADRLAPLVPMAVEKRIGDGADKQVRVLFGDKICDRADGQAALTKMVDKLKRAGALDVDLEAKVIDSKTPNAFALPGGRVYLLDGLLQKANNADEVAGVMGHELGHVKNRDSMRRIIQTGGTSFLIGLLFGDVTGSTAMLYIGRELFDSSYSRENERDADGFAIEVMNKLGRSPKPMGEFLLRVTGQQATKSISILASHPMSEDRLARMAKHPPAVPGEPILSDAEWLALKNICKSS
jgi:Zn-dependent protease with chaperone function